MVESNEPNFKNQIDFRNNYRKTKKWR